jgi:hypothetical protein
MLLNTEQMEEELRVLTRLKERGILTESEFAVLKKRLENETHAPDGARAPKHISLAREVCSALIFLILGLGVFYLLR